MAERGEVRQPLHRRLGLLAIARGPDLRPLQPAELAAANDQDRSRPYKDLADATVEPSLPNLWKTAARRRIPDALCRQVARIDPNQQSVAATGLWFQRTDLSGPRRRQPARHRWGSQQRSHLPQRPGHQ